MEKREDDTEKKKKRGISNGETTQPTQGNRDARKRRSRISIHFIRDHPKFL